MAGLFGDMFDDGPAPAQPPRQQQKPQPQPPSRRHDFKKGPYTMPFGKHKGEVVVELPLSYLVWLWWKREGEPLRDPLASCVRKGLESYNVDPDGDEPEVPDDRR